MKNFNFPNQEDDINFYNTEKYSQALEPKSESERKLWPQLEGAERPIKNILKRINRLSLDKFPEAQFITMGSCSGHSTKDGKLIEFGVENSTTPDILFEIKVKHEAITDENNEEWDNIEDLDTNNSEKFIGFFRSLFNSAVEQVNKKFNGEVIRFGYIDRKNGGNFINKEFISPEPVLVYTPKEEKTYYSYNVDYNFNIGDIDRGRDILKDFWTNVENNLETFDKIPYKTNFRDEDFLENDLYVRA